MKKIIFTSAFLVSLPFFAVAEQYTETQSSVPVPVVTLKDPGFVPGGFLYFFDRLGEGFHFFYTFKPEAKARLALSYAEERAAEVNALLGDKSVDSREVLRAEEGFAQSLDRASRIVLSLKEQGVDVSSFARDIDTKFEASRAALKLAFHNYQEHLKTEDETLRQELKSLGSTGEEARVREIEERLNAHADEALKVTDREDLLDQGYAEEKHRLESSMGESQSAESHITNAKRARVQFLVEINARKLASSTEVVETLRDFDALMVNATRAFTDGDYENAKEFAQEAKNVLNDGRDTIDAQDIEKAFFEDESEGPESDSMRGKAPGNTSRDAGHVEIELE